MDAAAATAQRRVIFVNRFYRPDLSATSQMLTDLAEALAAQGMCVHVICSRQRYEDPRADLAPHEQLAGVQIWRVAGTRFGRRHLAQRAFDYLGFHVTASSRAWRLCRRGDVLVAKTDPPLLSVPLHWVARARGVRLVNWLQDLFPEVAAQLGAAGLSGWPGGALRAWRNIGLRAAACNVVLGERMRAVVLAQAVPAGRIAVIENWSDAQVRPMAAKQSALRASLGVAQACVVGYSGNLGRAHDFRTLLGAMLRLRARTDIHFVMIGGGTGMEALREAVGRQHLPAVHFLPAQPRAMLGDALAAIDIHLATLLPALEGLIVPSKFYGILAAARPVVFIGDPQGELGRIVAQEDLGAVVRCGDEQALAAVLAALADDPQRRLSCSLRARALFERRYTLRRALDQWRRVLAQAGLPR